MKDTIRESFEKSKELLHSYMAEDFQNISCIGDYSIEQKMMLKKIRGGFPEKEEFEDVCKLLNWVGNDHVDAVIFLPIQRIKMLVCSLICQLDYFIRDKDKFIEFLYEFGQSQLFADETIFGGIYDSRMIELFLEDAKEFKRSLTDETGWRIDGLKIGHWRLLSVLMNLEKLEYVEGYNEDYGDELRRHYCLMDKNTVNSFTASILYSDRDLGFEDHDLSIHERSQHKKLRKLKINDAIYISKMVKERITDTNGATAVERADIYRSVSSKTRGMAESTVQKKFVLGKCSELTGFMSRGVITRIMDRDFENKTGLWRYYNDEAGFKEFRDKYSRIECDYHTKEERKGDC